ncbi:MAG: response regulator [Rhodobacteraceae bacterium]|nr:MAG: response regulator [Paracoccaceae bacterium]
MRKPYAPSVDARLSDVFEHGPVGVLEWRRDQGWRVVLATANLERIVGHPAAELLSGAIEYADLIHEQDNPGVFERIGVAASRGDEALTLSYRLITPAGETRRIHDRTRILRDATGEPEAFVSYLLDVTDEPSDAAAKEYVAHMSHEIRTPLAGMIGLAEALAETPLNPEQADILTALNEAGASLLQLVNNVLDLSKIEAGAMTLDISDFRLGELCTTAERLFARRAAANGVALTTRGQAMDIRLRGDAGRLRQLLFNLVSNAVKFTSEGRIEIAWAVDPPDERQRIRARISVSDTGLGMSQDTIGRIFESYRQADSRTAAEFGGTGLGLAISKQLAAMMGGRLWVESALGEGSTFFFESTFEASAAEQPELAALQREEENAAARASLTARAPRILAAEDTTANQRVLELLLTPLNVEVVIARDGREAIERFQEGRFDLVLMDSRMPRLGGIEATQEIRRMERAAGRSPTPIIALTAETLDTAISAFRGAGVDEILPKPFEPNRLIRVIAETLSRAPAQSAARTS